MYTESIRSSGSSSRKSHPFAALQKSTGIPKLLEANVAGWYSRCRDAVYSEAIAKLKIISG
jgi:hypothetical protein